MSAEESYAHSPLLDAEEGGGAPTNDGRAAATHFLSTKEFKQMYLGRPKGPTPSRQNGGAQKRGGDWRTWEEWQGQHPAKVNHSTSQSPRRSAGTCVRKTKRPPSAYETRMARVYGTGKSRSSRLTGGDHEGSGKTNAMSLLDSYLDTLDETNAAETGGGHSQKLSAAAPSDGPRGAPRPTAQTPSRGPDTLFDSKTSRRLRSQVNASRRSRSRSQAGAAPSVGATRTEYDWLSLTRELRDSKVRVLSLEKMLQRAQVTIRALYGAGYSDDRTTGGRHDGVDHLGSTTDACDPAVAVGEAQVAHEQSSSDRDRLAKRVCFLEEKLATVESELAATKEDKGAARAQQLKAELHAAQKTILRLRSARPVVVEARSAESRRVTSSPQQRDSDTAAAPPETSQNLDQPAEPAHVNTITELEESQRVLKLKEKLRRLKSLYGETQSDMLQANAVAKELAEERSALAKELEMYRRMPQELLALSEELDTTRAGYMECDRSLQQYKQVFDQFPSPAAVADLIREHGHLVGLLQRKNEQEVALRDEMECLKKTLVKETEDRLGKTIRHERALAADRERELQGIVAKLQHERAEAQRALERQRQELEARMAEMKVDREQDLVNQLLVHTSTSARHSPAASTGAHSDRHGIRSPEDQERSSLAEVPTTPPSPASQSLPRHSGSRPVSPTEEPDAGPPCRNAETASHASDSDGAASPATSGSSSNLNSSTNSSSSSSSPSASSSSLPSTNSSVASAGDSPVAAAAGSSALKTPDRQRDTVVSSAIPQPQPQHARSSSTTSSSPSGGDDADDVPVDVEIVEVNEHEYGLDDDSSNTFPVAAAAPVRAIFAIPAPVAAVVPAPPSLPTTPSAAAKPTSPASSPKRIGFSFPSPPKAMPPPISILVNRVEASFPHFAHARVTVHSPSLSASVNTSPLSAKSANEESITKTATSSTTATEPTSSSSSSSISHSSDSPSDAHEAGVGDVSSLPPPNASPPAAAAAAGATVARDVGKTTDAPPSDGTGQPTVPARAGGSVLHSPIAPMAKAAATYLAQLDEHQGDPAPIATLFSSPLNFAPRQTKSPTAANQDQRTDSDVLLEGEANHASDHSVGPAPLEEGSTASITRSVSGRAIPTPPTAFSIKTGGVSPFPSSSVMPVFTTEEEYAQGQSGDWGTPNVFSANASFDFVGGLAERRKKEELRAVAEANENNASSGSQHGSPMAGTNTSAIAVASATMDAVVASASSRWGTNSVHSNSPSLSPAKTAPGLVLDADKAKTSPPEDYVRVVSSPLVGDSQGNPTPPHPAPTFLAAAVADACANPAEEDEKTERTGSGFGSANTQQGLLNSSIPPPSDLHDAMHHDDGISSGNSVSPLGETVALSGNVTAGTKDADIDHLDEGGSSRSGRAERDSAESDEECAGGGSGEKPSPPDQLSTPPPVSGADEEDENGESTARGVSNLEGSPGDARARTRSSPVEDVGAPHQDDTQPKTAEEDNTSAITDIADVSPIHGSSLAAAVAASGENTFNITPSVQNDTVAENREEQPRDNHETQGSDAGAASESQPPMPSADAAGGENVVLSHGAAPFQGVVPQEVHNEESRYAADEANSDASLEDSEESFTVHHQ